MNKELLRMLQVEIRRHGLDGFVDEPPSVAPGEKRSAGAGMSGMQEEVSDGLEVYGAHCGGCVAEGSCDV
jgi:hypothetical protein